MWVYSVGEMSLLRKLFLALAAIAVLGLVGTEAFLWLVKRQPDSPSARFYFETGIPGLSPHVEYAVNDKRLRTLNWSEGKKQEGALRVLCVGGASTELLVHNVEDTWWGRLAQDLELRTGKAIEIACYGSGRDYILGGARWCAENLRDLDVDLLIVSYGLGDVLQGGEGYRYDPDKYFKIRLDSRARWKQTASEYSQIYRALSLWKKRKIIKARQETMETEGFLVSLFQARREAYAELPFAREVHRELAHDPLLEYLDGIDRFVSICEETGTGLLVFGEPVLHSAILGPDEIRLLRAPLQASASGTGLSRPDPGWVARELERFYDAGRVRCAEAGVAFNSLEGRVPKTTKYFIGDSLLTLEGCARVAALAVPGAEAVLVKRGQGSVLSGSVSQ